MGGVEIFVKNLAMFLKKNGNEVKIYSTSVFNNDSLGKEDFNDGIRYFSVNNRSRLILRPFVSMYYPKENIFNEISRENFDILHFNNVTDLTFPYCLYNLGVPKIFTPHTLYGVTKYDFIYGPRYYFLRKFLDRSNVIHALSAMDNQILTQMFKIAPSKVAVIPLGTNTSIFANDVDNKSNRILFVGRISPEKGLHVLLQALKNIEEPFELLVVGQECDKKYLRSIQSLLVGSLIKKVKFLGVVPHEKMPSIYASAGIFVQPSLFETFPLSLIEAMSCNLPVITTNIGISREIIKDQQNGFKVPINDIKKLREKLLILMKNQEIRESMGLKNRQLVHNHFQIESSFSNLLKVYEKLDF
jgi:glycosyltransferase involved in cell wall biosynthesis